MTKISLEWIRYPDRTITAVRAYGLTDEQLYHYARQVGFSAFQSEVCRPLLVGSIECCDELLALLESAGYEIESEEIIMPEIIMPGQVVAELRKDAQVARELEISIPRNIPPDQWRSFAEAVAEEITMPEVQS